MEERTIRVREVASSNLATPTKEFPAEQDLALLDNSLVSDHAERGYGQLS